MIKGKKKKSDCSHSQDIINIEDLKHNENSILSSNESEESEYSFNDKGTKERKKSIIIDKNTLLEQQVEERNKNEEKIINHGSLMLDKLRSSI